MSARVSCKCIRQLSFRETRSIFRKQNWVVIQRNSNQSAFNGYRRTPSDYSEIQCRACRAIWRTKAKYVEYLTSGGLI